MKYECIDFRLAGQTVDNSKFTDADIERLTDSIIEWAEGEGIGIGGGLVGINDDDESPEDKLRAENARLQEQVEDKIAVIDVAAAGAVKLKTERDALQARAEEAEREVARLGTQTIVWASWLQMRDERDRYNVNMGEAWQEYRRLWLRWFEQRVEYRYAKKREREARALAERRKRAGEFLWWFIGRYSGDCDPGETVRKYGYAARAAIEEEGKR